MPKCGHKSNESVPPPPAGAVVLTRHFATDAQFFSVSANYYSGCPGWTGPMR